MPSTFFVGAHHIATSMALVAMNMQWTQKFSDNQNGWNKVLKLPMRKQYSATYKAEIVKELLKEEKTVRPTGIRGGHPPDPGCKDLEKDCRDALCRNCFSAVETKTKRGMRPASMSSK